MNVEILNYRNRTPLTTHGNAFIIFKDSLFRYRRNSVNEVRTSICVECKYGQIRADIDGGIHRFSDCLEV